MIEHVGKRQQSLELIVLDDRVGEILEEQIGLLLVHVERQVADLPALQRRG